MFAGMKKGDATRVVAVKRRKACSPVTRVGRGVSWWEVRKGQMSVTGNVGAAYVGQREKKNM